MKSNKERGFAPLEIVLMLVIVGLVAFIAWYVFKAKSNTDTTYGTVANTQANTNGHAATTGAVVVTKTDPKLGKYLTDFKGMTLYTYDSDTANTSNCTGSCLTDWPVYEATASATSVPANVSTITRADGTKQFTYNKMPLYYYTGDTKAGDINGDGVGGFSVAKP